MRGCLDDPAVIAAMPDALAGWLRMQRRRQETLADIRSIKLRRFGHHPRRLLLFTTAILRAWQAEAGSNRPMIMARRSQIDARSPMPHP